MLDENRRAFSLLNHDLAQVIAEHLEITIDVPRFVRERDARSCGPDGVPDAPIRHERAPRVDEPAIERPECILSRARPFALEAEAGASMQAMRTPRQPVSGNDPIDTIGQPTAELRAA